VGKRDEVHVVAASLPCCLPGGIIGSGCEDSDGYGWGEIRAREEGRQGGRESGKWIFLWDASRFTHRPSCKEHELERNPGMHAVVLVLPSEVSALRQSSTLYTTHSTSYICHSVFDHREHTTPLDSSPSIPISHPHHTQPLAGQARSGRKVVVKLQSGA
jgi:hypothetical protein